MRFWQSLAFCEPEQCAEIARHAEALGFEGVTLAEHQFFPERLDSRFPFTPDGRPLFDAEDEWPDMWPVIGAMTATTKRLRFCTSLNVLPLFPPLALARTAATAERMAPGRIRLGVGVGWMREEYDAFGVDFRTRGRRIEEAIEILRRAWAGEMFEFHGRFFEFDRLLVRPAPVEPIPIWIGGTSDAALRRAARLGDGWIGGGGSKKQLEALLARLRALRIEAGRASLPFETITLHTVEPGSDLDEIRELEAEGLDGVVHLQFRESLGRRSTLSEKKVLLDGFAEAVIRIFG